MTLTLFKSLPQPPEVDGVEFLCMDALAAIALLKERGVKFRLGVADPPWWYSQAPGKSNPELQYNTIRDMNIIVDMLDSTYDIFSDGRLLVWQTWPVKHQFDEVVIPRYLGLKKKDSTWRWGQQKTGGSWHKEGGGGVGYHWLGASEPVAMFVKGSPPAQRWGNLKNAHDTPLEKWLVESSFEDWVGGENEYRQDHSEKPTDWMIDWIERWTDEGDYVLDLFCGLGPLARACWKTKRRYVGIDSSQERIDIAKSRLALYMSGLL